jgi:4-amino-4-deoxy-L-arabinose transferase-like glycosyltransferase
MRRELLFLLIIILGAFFVRIYKFDTPIVDWHSWRQADTSAVSRNFIKLGYSIFIPRFDDLSNGVSLIDNPEGYRFVEFPIYNIFQAGFFDMFGTFSLEQWGRLVSIFSSLGAVVFLYLIVKKHISTRAGLIAAFLYAFIPYSIYYGRVILPDTMMIAFFLGGFYFFDVFLDLQSKPKKNLYYAFAIIFTAAAFLIKPFVVFLLPSFLYLVFIKRGIKGFKKLDVWMFLILTLLPFFLWRLWMQNFPEGIPRNDWLYNGTGIRFRPSFYWWIFAERISKIILGYWGLVFVMLGILFKPENKEKWLFFIFLIGGFLYLHVFATGNVQHDYYQILIVPILIIFFAKGIDRAMDYSKNQFNKYLTRLVIALCIFFSLLFGWYSIRDYYSISRQSMLDASKAVNELTPKDAKVIAVYNGDTTFLYHTNRQGWPVVERSFKDFISAGADYIAFAEPNEEELSLSELFEPLIIEERYAIFDLNKPTLLGLEELSEK